MKSLPENIKKYNATKVFSEGTIPAGLLGEHRTLEGVWGKIVVLKGKLLYVIAETGAEEVLDQDKFGVVEPQVTHYVKPLGEVSFYVEFYR